MFYLIGIGLTPKQLTFEAKEAISNCNEVYLESYTSTYAEGTVEELEHILEKPIKKLKRADVEEKFYEILKKAKKENVALLVYGNPLNATTHIQILIDCKAQKIEYKVIPGISIFDYLAAAGLDSYKFGRVATIVFPQKNYSPESFYDVIEKNQAIGLHTLCLLDINAEENKLMTVAEALNILEKIEQKRKKRIIKNSVLIALAGIGSRNQIIKIGKLADLKKFTTNVLPQSFIVCGKLNEKEKEALKVLYDYDA